MKLFLSSDRELLPVVDAVSLIAQHIVDIEGRPVLAEDGSPLPVGQSMLERQGRSAPNIQLIALEREWTGLIRTGWTKRKLVPRNSSGRFIDHTNALEVFVKPAELAQWLVDVHRMDVELDGVLIKPTSAPQKLKRKVLMKKYESIWPSIYNDLQDGSRNGLKEAAGVGGGYYWDQLALQWARAQDKLLDSWQVPITLRDFPVHRHLMGK